MNKHASLNRIYRLLWNERLRTWVPVAENSPGRKKRNGRSAATPALLLASLGLGCATHGLAAGVPTSGVPTAVAPTTLPTGGNVVAGTGTINSSTTANSAVLNVDQTSQRAVINWNTFNLGSAAQVNFNQPGSDSATLNRVLDSNPSQIFGKINAVGQVFLTNPNGVYFGKSAVADVGSLTATTGSIGDADFMAGKLEFDRNGATGSIVNEGELHAGLGGYVALLAPEVRNSGVIVARMGTVALAAGESITLNLDGNHLAGITATPSAIAALVENRSAVIAPGGLIILSAQAADSLQGGVVNNSGALVATGLSSKAGRIVLEASTTVENSGSINANAGNDGSPAGHIEITAPNVTNSGTISAAGAASSAQAPSVAAVAVTGGSVAVNATNISQSSTGKLDVSGLTGGDITLQAVHDVSLAGTLNAAAIDLGLAEDNAAPPAASAGHGGTLGIKALGNITLSDALLDASGVAAGGQISVAAGGAPAPTAPAGEPPTLALLGSTQVQTSSRRGQGGSIALTADQVGLFDASSVDASGATGGGTVRVGGDYQGRNPDIGNATATYVGANVTIAADALDSGDGGTVIVWSNQITRYSGQISARGGTSGGNGGFTEVSSEGQLDFRGGVNTLAPHGSAGTLLLDPYNLTISNGSDTNVSASTPFNATGTGSLLSVTTLQNALANSDVTVTTGSSGGEAGTLTVANTFGWFSNYSLTLSAASTLTVNSGVSVIAAGNGNITLTSSGGGLVNNGAVRTYGGNLSVNAAAGTVSGTGSYNVAGTATFTTSGDISLTNPANTFSGAVSLLSSTGQVQFNNSQATVLAGATSGAGGVSLTSGGSITSTGSPSGINTSTGPLSMTTASGSNGSILYTGTVSAGGNISLAADGTGAISIPAINGAATFASVVAGGAITLGNSSTGALTFNSGGGTVLSGTPGSGGQASGTVNITGSSITLDDPLVTKGGNLTLTATSGAVTAISGANITTSANSDTGTASGGVTVTAANGITLQNVVTTGADNSLGVGSNASAVTLMSTLGNVNVGAITTSGGAATSGATSNRNGGNAGNIVITAPAGTIYLNGDLNAIGGTPVGTATQGLGGYIDLENAVVLTADRSVSSGATSGDILFNSTIDSDGTSRSLSVTAGIGSVIFGGAVGGSAPLSSLTVESSTTTTVQGNVTTNAAGGVWINANTINLGNNTVANSLGAITIDTSAGNGTVNMNGVITYLDDAVTFTRGTGPINFAAYLYSYNGERNNLTFNGSNGGAISVDLDVGGSSGAFSTTALGDILVSSVTDLSFGNHIAASSLVSLNSTGRLSVGCSSCSSYFDGAAGLQLATTGTANNYSGDENIGVNANVTLSNASAPLSISAPNGSISFTYPYIGLTTAGGNLTLKAGGSLTLPSAGALSSNGGQVSLSGVTVSQAADDTVNAGSGKIRVDGGAGDVTLNGVLQTTDADSGGSPAVLITDAGAVSLRSVTAQTGTLQVGLVGSASNLAAAQSLSGAGALTLTSNTSYYAPRRITLSSAGNSASVSFTITGTDANGNTVSQTIGGPNNGTVTTTQYFETVTGIVANSATTGTVTAGVANEAVTGSLTQYTPGNYTNSIDVHTLSVASNAAIAITSTSNIIDQLGTFSVGSSLDVEANGRTAGMQLTGDVTATSVTISTGTGPLALGNYNITSTTGNVWLQGRGITQSSSSTVTSAGSVTLFGADYQTGTEDNVTLNGSIVAASTAGNAVLIDEAGAVQLGNVTAGTIGSRGGLQLGSNSDYNNGSYFQHGYITGSITQAAGTSVKIGQFGAVQTGGSDITLTNQGNEIASIGSYLGYLYRNGGISIYDADTEGNGLTIDGRLSDGNNSNNAPIMLETTGALAINNTTWGTSLLFSGSSITDNGAQVVSFGSTELRPHGGDVTLNGTWYVNWASSGTDALVIRNAGNVQLSYLNANGSATGLTFGAAGTSGALAAAQSSSGGALTLNGTSTSGGSATFATAQRVAITCSGNDSGVTFTVTGTDSFGRAQTDTITGADATSAVGSKYFATVTSITASGATAGNITVGTATENVSGNVTQVYEIINATSVSGVVGGSTTLNSGANSFQQIGNLTSGGDLTLYSAVNPLTVAGAVVSTSGNVNISSGYGLTVSSTGSVAAEGSGKNVTLASNNEQPTSIQGAISADTGGITINSSGTFDNTNTGTLTTTGGVSIKTYWDGANRYDLTLGGNITAGANGIELNSSGAIDQTGGVLSTPGALSGPDSSGGGSPGAGNPSARGSVTLNDANQVGSLGPWYVYNTSGSTFSFNNTNGGLTLAGAIETSNGDITIGTAGGALSLATYGVYAGELASGGANVSLTGQGITQASGTISATGSNDGTTPRNGSSGGTITLTGYDGTGSGSINLGGTLQTANNTASAVTIRGTAALALPNISAPNGSLNLGDSSQSYYHITGPITQTASTALDIKTLNVAADSSAVLANTGNQIVQLGDISVGNNAGVDYDFDVYNSTNGLSLTHDVTSAGGVRIVTTEGSGSSGALALGNYNVYATGDIYLAGQGVTQGSSSTVDANHAGAPGAGGNISVDGGGGTNNITLGGTVRTDGTGSTLAVLDATNATLNVISATAGTVVLGTSSLPLSGSVSEVPTTGVVSAGTLQGYAGIVALPVSNIDNLGSFTTTGALTLEDQGGAGAPGMTLTGNVTVGAASDIETSDGALNLSTYTIDASGGTGYDLVLQGVGVSQDVGSQVKSTTAEIYAGTGNINLFSALNQFTGQVTVNSTGSQVSIRDAGQLSMNALTGKLASTTSIQAWAGTNLVLTPESITTTSGNIDFRSLNGNLSTPGNLTTGSGSVTLIAGGTGANGNVQVNNTISSGSGNVTVQAATQANLSNSIVSTSGNISVSGDTVIHSTGSPGNPLTLQTGGAGTIMVDASGTGGFVMGQYYSYQSGSGAISITSGGTADLANITTSGGDVTVSAGGAVQQGSSSSIDANALAVTATNSGSLTLANANNDVGYISLRSLNAAGTASGTGAISYNDLNAVAVRQIQTAGNVTLTAGGAITTDTTTGPGTITAAALSVKTLNDNAADISLTAAGNDVASVTLNVRNAADTANVGVPGSTGNIDFTDVNGFSITGIGSGGNAALTAGGPVVETGPIVLARLSLSGVGSFTLNNASSGVPINQVSTFASNASGAVNFSSSRALAVGTVTAAGPITGITTDGASITLSAPTLDTSAGPIDTRSAVAGTDGGAVTLTTTGTGSAGNLTVGRINTSGSNAAVSTNGNGGAAGAINLTSSGDTLVVGGVMTARGGAGDGSGVGGAAGLVSLTAASGAVTQANGSGADAINAGKLLVSAANTSSFLDTGNTTDFVAARITGAGQGFTYRSGSNYTVGAGNGTITGLSTQGGAIDLGSSNVAITEVETITTQGGAFSADGIGRFNSTGVTLSTLGNITYAAGAYKNGGAVSITTNSGPITTGPIITDGDSSASDAAAGPVTLNANGVLTTASISAAGAGTGAGGTVLLTGTTVRLGGPISTGGGTGGGTQAAGGDITVTGPAVVYGGDLVLSTGSGTGDVTFSNTLDSDNVGSLRSLTVSAGNGNIDLEGVVGGSIPLKNVVLNSSAATTLAAPLTASSLTTDATGTTTLHGGSINTTGNQTYGDDVILSAGTTLSSGGNVSFAATVMSDGTNRALTVNDSGVTTFGGAVGGDGSVAGQELASLATNAGGTTAINGGSIITAGTQTYGDHVTLGADTHLTGSTVTTQGTVTGNTRVLGITGNAVFGNNTADTVTGLASLSVSGTTGINTNTLSSTGAQTYTGAVVLGADTTLSGIGVSFASTVKSDGTNRALTLNDSGTTTFGGAVGGDGSVAGDELASLTTTAGGTTAINGGSIITAGTQTYGANVTLGADTHLSGATVMTQGLLTGNSHALSVTGNALFGDSTGDAVTGLTTLAVSGTTLINTGTITTSGAQTYSGAVTLGTDTTLTGSALNFNSTVDSDATTARSLTLNSTGPSGQTFLAAVGGINALNALSIASAGVVTQGGTAPIYAAQLAIKSAGNVTLDNTGNSVGVLAALMSGNASLTFVDSTGLEIGSVGSGALQVIGISDGVGTSNVSITLAGPLTQAVGAPIVLHGNLALDTSAYDAGDVTVKNTAAAGTVLDNSLIAGDFNLSSTGDVTQKPGAYLQVGGNFNLTGGGIFTEGSSPNNLVGGGSASVSGNEIKLFGVITLSMDAGTGDLLASAWNGTSTTTASIASSALASGVQVVSAAGGNSISAVNSGPAITLGEANSLGGSVRITTQGTYSNSGTAVATGIDESNALHLGDASFTVQQSAVNPGSAIAGAGKLDLSNTGNTFSGTVSMFATGMNATLAAGTNINLGTVYAQDVTVSTTQNVTQAVGRTVQADTLLLQNAQSVTLNNTNRVNTLAASGLTGTLSFTDAQSLSVGTASAVNGIGSSGSVVLQTTTGDLVLEQAITVSGGSDITLASAGNFINNVGANAFTLGTGHWQVWSTDPSLDTINGLSPDFKQYDATYGTSTVLGSGNGAFYTLAPQLTVSLTGSVTRAYDAGVDAALTQGNYNVTGLLAGDAVVLGTSGAFDNKNVGSGKTITVNPTIVSASDGSMQVYGYQIDSGSASVSGAIGTITPATISAVTGITAANKTYDGNTSATLNTSSTLGFTGLFSGDNLTVASATGTFASPNASANPIAVSVTGITLGGTDAGNYTLSTPTASTSASIAPYAVSLTGTRTYDGTTTVGAGVLTLGPLVGSETLTLSGSGVASSKNVGTQTVGVSGLMLADGTGLASNYTFTGGTQTVDITQANLTVTPSNVSKTYDGSLSASGSAVVAGGTQLFGGDSLSGGTYTFTNANAGTGNKTVTVSGVTVNDGDGGADYNVSYVSNTTSTINPASITVDAANITKTYDGTLTANGTANLVSGALYHNASNGNAQDTLSGGSFAFTDPNAGSGNKTVTASGVTVNDGNGGGNYVVTYVNNTTSTINPAQLTFNGTIADKTYDGTTAATLSGYTLTGLVGDQTLDASASSAAFADKNAGIGKAVSISGITLSDGTNGGLASNYSVSPTAAATGTIDPKVLTVNANVADKVYDGTTSATLLGFGLTGFVGNETLTGVLTGTASFADKNVGTDKGVTITGVNLLDGTNGGLASNYTVSTAADSTASITPATLHIAGVVALNKVYDGTTVANLDTQAAVITGVFGSDQVQISSITGTYQTKDVGSNKAIGPGVVVLSGTDSDDYTLAQPTGLSSSITPRPLTVSATGVDKTYDGTTAATVNLADNRIAGDSFTVTSTDNFIDPSAGTDRYINVSNIALNGADAQDYMVNGSTSTYANIARAPLTVTAVGVNKVYDGTTNATVILSDTPLAGDTVDVSYASASFANQNVGNGKAVTITGITLSGAQGDDYTVIDVPSAAANITPAPLSGEPDSLSRQPTLPQQVVLPSIPEPVDFTLPDNFGGGTASGGGG